MSYTSMQQYCSIQASCISGLPVGAPLGSRMHCKDGEMHHVTSSLCHQDESDTMTLQVVATNINTAAEAIAINLLVLVLSLGC